MNRITFGQVVEPMPPEEVLPPQLLGRNTKALRQQWRSERILVFIQQQTYASMHVHAETDKQHECTGIMVGQVFHDPHEELPFVIIDQTIPLEAVSRSEVHVQIDAAQLSQTRLAMQQQLPGSVIVGWYHTHPNLGIFLSGTDLQVTEGLFNASWHVATVIDPVQRQEGSFVAQGKQPISSLIQINRPTPIVTLLALYRKARELREVGDHEQAQRYLIHLQESYERAINAEFRADLSRWIERGAYRNLPDLLHPTGESAESSAVMRYPPSNDRGGDDATNRLLQDLLRIEADTARNVQQLTQRIGTRSHAGFTVTTWLVLFFGLLISFALGLDIFLQWSTTKRLDQQNRLIETVISQQSPLQYNEATPAQLPTIPLQATPVINESLPITTNDMLQQPSRGISTTDGVPAGSP